MERNTVERKVGWGKSENKKVKKAVSGSTISGVFAEEGSAAKESHFSVKTC